MADAPLRPGPIDGPAPELTRLDDPGLVEIRLLCPAPLWVALEAEAHRRGFCPGWLARHFLLRGVTEGSDQGTKC